jgi:hypothetical protein
LKSYARMGAKYVGTTLYVLLPGMSAPLFVWPRQFQ